MLRVTAGTLRGLKLAVPDERAVRPALEMTRQAIFNILGQDFDGLRVADLFAGSGIMGIEAMSRGAAAAVFVERDRAGAACIRKNLEKARLTDAAEVIASDVFHPARYLDAAAPFDLVFIDPPFDTMRNSDGQRRMNSLLSALFDSPAIAQAADVVLRLPEKCDFRVEDPRILLYDDRTYGQSRVIFLCRRPQGG